MEMIHRQCTEVIFLPNGAMDHQFVASAIIFKPAFSSVKESKHSSRPDEFKTKYNKFCPFIPFTYFCSLVTVDASVFYLCCVA